MTTQLENPPTLEATPEWLAARRAHIVCEATVGAVRERVAFRAENRRLRLAIVVVVVAALTTGAALAASAFDLLPWLDSDDRAEARYSVDRSRAVGGSFPQEISCPAPTGRGAFACTAGREGRWVFMLLDRVTTQPELTRESLLAVIAAAEDQGRVTPELARRVREQIAAVGDDFFESLGRLQQIQSVFAAEIVRPGVVRVPSGGIPPTVMCERAGAELSCRDLAGSPNVPVGTPLYGIVRAPEWVERPRGDARADAERLMEAVFGRPLTEAEVRLLITLATAGTTGGEGGDAETFGPTTGG